MANERFTSNKQHQLFDNGEYFANVEYSIPERNVLKKLNTLNHEIEQLKSEIKEQKIQLNFITDQKNNVHRKLLERNNSIALLEKENRRLKQELGEEKHMNSLWNAEDTLSSEEIERLKNKLSDYADDLSRLTKENDDLKSEINMLKTTIARNEAYIKRLTTTSNWRC